MPRTAHAPAIALAFALAACGSDPRTSTNDNGTLAFAPVKNSINAEAGAAAPHFPPEVPVPPQGFVIVQSSFGDTTTYVFNAGSGLLTGLWSEPTAPGFTPPAPERHAATLAKNEQAALIRLINLAWGARHPAPGREVVDSVSQTVWLLDGAQFKALSGYRAGEVINDEVISLAQKHQIAPDNHEK